MKLSNLFVHFKLGVVSFQALLKFPFLLQLHSLLKSRASLPQVLQAQKKLPGSWLKGGEKPDWRGRERSRSASRERRRKGDKPVLAQKDTARPSWPVLSNLYHVQATSGWVGAQENRGARAGASRGSASRRGEEEEGWGGAETSRGRKSSGYEGSGPAAETGELQVNLPPSLLTNQGGDSLPFCLFFDCISVRRNKPERGPEQSSWDKSGNYWRRRRMQHGRRERRWRWKLFDVNVNALCICWYRWKERHWYQRYHHIKEPRVFTKAVLFCSGLRRSCGEPGEQIRQIRWGLLFRF